MTVAFILGVHCQTEGNEDNKVSSERILHLGFLRFLLFLQSVLSV